MKEMWVGRDNNFISPINNMALNKGMFNVNILFSSQAPYVFVLQIEVVWKYLSKYQFYMWHCLEHFMVSLHFNSLMIAVDDHV